MSTPAYGAFMRQREAREKGREHRAWLESQLARAREAGRQEAAEKLEALIEWVDDRIADTM